MNVHEDHWKATERLFRQHQEALRFLAIMVERAGGEVRMLPGELMVDRTIAKSELPSGAVELRVTR